MNRSIGLFFIFVFALCCVRPASGEDDRLSVDEIVEGVEKQYAGPGFSVLFHQTTTLKAMDITDTAVGKLFVKKPGKMRWEYAEPENQIIITDSVDLWIYKPLDQQAMKGKAPSFFGDGKGAGFLSDVKQLRKNFIVLPGGFETKDYVTLKLLTKEKQFDLSRIDLWISKENFEILQVTTYNAYDDETRIEFTDYRPEKNLPDTLFQFQVPEGVDVIAFDE
jgi:outer membrane lipoprotein carrier protein